MTQLRDLMRREPRYGLVLPAWLDRLLSVGIVTRDPQVARRQRCVNAAAYAGLVSGASYILVTLGQLYVIWMLGITSDLHVFFVLAGATLFFFGVQNWKLFLGVFVSVA